MTNLAMWQMRYRRPSVWRAGLLAVLLHFGAFDAAADIVSTPRWAVSVNGTVKAAVERNGVVYLAGQFDHVYKAPPADPLFVDRETGARLSGCASKTGLFELIPDASDGAFVQIALDALAPETFWDGNGPFVVPAGTTFLRILSNCRYDRGFVPPKISASTPNQPLSILDTGGVVLATMPGVSSARLAVYDRITGHRIASRESWPVVVMELVGMAGPNTAVVMAGANPPNVSYSLRHLTLSTLTLSGPLAPLPDRPAATWLSNGRVFVQPQLLTPQPTYAFDSATLQPSPGWTDPVGLDRVVVAGDFVFHASAQGLVRRDAITGAIDPAWQVRPGLQPIGADGARLLVRATGSAAVASLDAQTGTAGTWAVNALSDVMTTATVVGQTIALGRVGGVDGVARRKVAAVSAATGALLPFDPLLTSAPLQSLPLLSWWPNAGAVNATHLYLAIEGYGLLRVDLATGAVDSSWVAFFTRNSFRSVPVVLDATDQTLFAGGRFTHLVGTFGVSSVPQTARRGAAAIDLTTGQLTAWNPDVVDTNGGDTVRAMARASDAMYLGGSFTTVGGQPRAGFARVDLASGTVLNPVLPVPLDLRDIATDGYNAFVVVPTLSSFILARVTPGGAVTTAQAPSDTTIGRPLYAGNRFYADRERDAITLQPTTSTLLEWFAFAVEGGVMTSNRTNNFGGNLAYHPFAVAAPPASPQHLSAITTGNAVTLSWSQGAADVSEGSDVGSPTSYVVRAGSGTGLSNLADIDTGTLATSLDATAPNGTYFVRVHARNAFGLSPASNEVSFTLGPQACAALPGAPGQLSAAVSGTTVSLTWGAASSAATYVLEAGTGSGLADLATLNVGAGLSFGASAAPGLYFLRVRGSNACGTGPASNEVPVTLGAGMAPPGTPQALSAEVGGTTVTLTWSPPADGGAPTGYVLEAGSSQGLADLARAPVAGLALVAQQVPPGRYFVRVRAVNAAGTGPATVDIEVVVP